MLKEKRGLSLKALGVSGILMKNRQIPSTCRVPAIRSAGVIKAYMKDRGGLDFPPKSDLTLWEFDRLGVGEMMRKKD